MREYKRSTRFNFEKLEVWNEAIAFADTVYTLTKAFPEEEPDGMSRLVSLLYGLVFGRQLAEKWPKAGGRTWRMAVFVAEIEVETGPLMVVWPLGRRHLSLFQPPLERYPRFLGNLLHRKMIG